jgi:uncharacterized membrane protein
MLSFFLMSFTSLEMLLLLLLLLLVVVVVVTVLYQQASIGEFAGQRSVSSNKRFGRSYKCTRSIRRSTYDDLYHRLASSTTELQLAMMETSFLRLLLPSDISTTTSNQKASAEDGLREKGIDRSI